jgi:hypothetical protein
MVLFYTIVGGTKMTATAIIQNQAVEQWVYELNEELKSCSSEVFRWECIQRRLHLFLLNNINSNMLDFAYDGEPIVWDKSTITEEEPRMAIECQITAK